MPNYTVTFPDGQKQQFSGPKGMSETDAFARATQERAIAEGRVQTTWFGGAAKQMGQEKGANAALMTGAGMLTGAAPVVALAPLAADWIDYATKKFTGEQADTPTMGQQAVDLGAGVTAAYGPKAIAGALSGFAESTVPHVSSISGKFVKGASGSGVLPWAVRTVGELSNAAEQSPLVQGMQNAPTRLAGGLALGASALPVVLAQVKQTLTMPESKRVVDLRRQGQSEAQALQAIATQRGAK